MEVYDTQLFVNPQAGEFAEYGVAQREIINHEAFAVAKAEITSWPGYERTPLVGLEGLAAAHGIGALWCKYEGARFGLGSFKPTGPTYAMLGVLKGEVRKAAGVQVVETEDLVGGTYRDITRGIVVAAATSGNHGRAMAWGARIFGCRAVLYMNEGVSEGRARAIVGYGGEVIRVEGAYEGVVERLNDDAAKQGYFVISDQPVDQYPGVPKAIMQGYAMVADEVVEQLDQPPTHVFVPGGGGILAGACCGQLWERYGRHRPRLIVVEPKVSCCLYESARAGHLAGDDAGHVAPREQRLGQLAHRLRGRSFAHADHDDTVPDGHDVAAFQRGRPEFPRRIAEPDPHSIRECRIKPVDCCHQQRFGPPCREMHRVQAHAAIDPG